MIPYLNGVKRQGSVLIFSTNKSMSFKKNNVNKNVNKQDQR